MEYLTTQQIFDKVAEHLLTQKERSIKNGKCLYRGPYGLKCAIGALIPDELYKPEWDNECLNSDALPLDLFEAICINYEEQSNTLYYLQDLHDAVKTEEWKEALIAFASSRHLDYSVCLKDY